MKKQYIIIISIIALLAIIAGIYFVVVLQKQNNMSGEPSNNQQQSGSQTKLSIDDLETDNYVTIFTEGSDESVASRIMVCASSTECGMPGGSKTGSKQTGSEALANNGGSQPSGENKTGDPNGGATRSITLLSGTITGKTGESITIKTDSGDSKTVTVSDSTQIFERQ